jgi:phenylacetate-CoA ligase
MAYGGNISRNIYYHAPHLLKNIISSSFGLIQRKERYGSNFQKHFNFLNESQYWDNEKLKIFAFENTIKFIDKSLSGTKYYLENNYYHNWSLNKKLENLPLLTKDQVRENQKDLYNYKLKSIKHKWAHTSGTTGKSLIFPLSADAFQREYAFRALHYQWSDVSLTKRDKIAICSGHPVANYNSKNPPFWVYDYSNNWLIFSSYHLSEINLPFYIKELERFSPMLIHGYPSSVYLLALAYKKYGKGKLKLKAIYTSSETLLDFQRITIENAFQVKVFNWYGNAEMVANIVECEKSELHLKYEHSFIEILDENNQHCKLGETGRIVSTGFGNDAFPLIRYVVGDLVTIAKNQYPKCGRGGLLIEKI